MALAIRVLNGPLKNRFAPLKPGLTFGRKGASLSLPDPKVSQLHAIVEKNQAGQLILKDRGSANGILVEEKRRESVVLAPGLVLSLGDTRLEVGSISENGQKFVSLRPEGVDVEPLTWTEYFADFCQQSAEAVKNDYQNYVPLPKLVEFEFIRGPMISRKFYMAYGPRTLGPNSYEFPLLGEDIPDDVVTVCLDNDEIQLKTRHPSLVKLNNKPIMTAAMSNGDVLELSEHLIRIKLKDIS